MLPCKHSRAPHLEFPLLNPSLQHSSTLLAAFSILSVRGQLWIGAPPLEQGTRFQAVSMRDFKMPWDYSFFTDTKNAGRFRCKILRRNIGC
jgi:hypothetical protein